MSEENKVLTPDNEDEPKELETPQTPVLNDEPKPEVVTLTKEEHEKLLSDKKEAENKFSNSTREAQILTESNKQLENKLNSLTNNINPTDDDLKGVYPNWDYLNDETKLVYRDLYITNKKADAATKLVMDMVEEKKWNDDFRRTINSYPKLKGREKEFKQFAYKPTHKGVTLDVLAKSFLFDFKDDSPDTPITPTPALESGSGGNHPPLNNKMSSDDIAHIRETDPKRYKQLIKDKVI